MKLKRFITRPGLLLLVLFGLGVSTALADWACDINCPMGYNYITCDPYGEYLHTANCYCDVDGFPVAECIP